MSRVMIGRVLRLAFPVVLLASCPSIRPAMSAEVSAAAVASRAGDGPDQSGNTEDDTWQFWFQLVHAPSRYRRLDLHSSAHPQGIPGKVTGPVASATPNPADTAGWIFHSDWDGRFEGVWGDARTGQVLAHPYNEKSSGADVAMTFRVPRDGAYDIRGRVSYLRPAGGKSGVRCKVGLCSAARDEVGADLRWLTKSDVGTPEAAGSAEFSIRDEPLKAGQLVMLAIDPLGHWGGDMTRIDEFTVAPAGLQP